MSEKSTDLTRKEERFCENYIVDYNGTAAAKRAGYAEKSARVAASRLLKQDRVKARIRELQKEQAERLCLSSDLIVIRALELYDKCTQADVPDSKGAVKCLDLLARHLGMFDKDSQSASDGPVFICDDIGVVGDG